MPFVEKVITAGDIKEVRRYFSSRIGKNIPRGPNENKTPEQVEKVNARIAKDKLEKLVHANFIGGVDYFTTLTYRKFENDKNHDWAKNPATKQEIQWMKSECTKHMRKLRDWYKKQGITLKYIKVTEIRDKDGVGIRPHHHLIISMSSMDALAEMWPHGRVTTSRLDMDYDRINELVSYFTKQKLEPAERQILSKRWDQSKNLDKPDVDIKEIKSISVSRPPKEVTGVGKGMKKYQGYKIIEWQNGYNDITGPWQYVKMVKIADSGPVSTEGKSKPSGAKQSRKAKKANTKRRC